MTRFYIYLLASRRHGTLYLGVTNDLVRRVYEHKTKVVPGFTRRYGVDRWSGSRSMTIPRPRSVAKKSSRNGGGIGKSGSSKSRIRNGATSTRRSSSDARRSGARHSREPGTHEHGPRQLRCQLPNALGPDGRMAALYPWVEGGKSGLHGGTVPGNARRGRPQGKCHRKYTAGPSRDTGRPARVKRCGKSAPRRRQRRRQGKPHREQDQVGAAGIPLRGNAGRTFAPPLGSVARGARQRASQRNGHPRPKDQLLGSGQNPAYTPSGAFL